MFRSNPLKAITNLLPIQDVRSIQSPVTDIHGNSLHPATQVQSLSRHQYQVPVQLSSCGCRLLALTNLIYLLLESLGFQVAVKQMVGIHIDLDFIQVPAKSNCNSSSSEV